MEPTPLFARALWCAPRKTSDMAVLSTNLDAHAPRSLIVSIGLGWSVAFPVLALCYELELYGDGAMFSYAVAVQDVWAFHWHNISGRSSVFFLTLLPAEAIVGATGRPWPGIIAYGLLFYSAPLIGLIATYFADRSPRRSIFFYACCSTALLCPLIFGFPTEMWLAHAIFWPALAMSHYAKPTVVGAALVFVAGLLLAFTHEGALVLLFVIVMTLVPRGLRSVLFQRAVVSLIAVLTLAAVSKFLFPPDDYYAAVLLRAALHFFNPEIFEVNVVLLLAATLTAFGAIFVATSTLFGERAWIYSLGIVLLGLCIYWLQFDHSVHASSRYYLRTALVLLTPMFGTVAALSAMAEDGITVCPLAKLRHFLISPNHQAVCAFAAAFVLVTLVHAVETGKFVSAWTGYRNAVATLATGHETDPSLGDPNFVSSARTSQGLNALSWFSTIPYLSVILANFSPSRLVIDPTGNYFWLACATATQNKDADRVVPVQARELVRIYSCLHR
jgi:hypothetical protein